MSDAFCLMVNCTRPAPAGEAFCSKHREHKPRVLEAMALREALEWLERYLRDTPHHNSPAAANARAVLRATMHSDCSQSHDGRHHIDTSMEEGPHHCFHCGVDMRAKGD